MAVIARVPLASRFLSGKFGPQTQFDKADHRNFNRYREAFDVGETFSGVPFETGLKIVEKIRPLVHGNVTMAQFCLRWILINDVVTVVIPGARGTDQARANAEADDLPPLSAETMAEIKKIYDEDVRPHVHPRW